MRKTLHSEQYGSFCEALKLARKTARLSQQQLARKLKEHQSFVSRYETGERRLDVVEFIAVAEAIGFDPAALVNKIARGLTKIKRPKD